MDFPSFLSKENKSNNKTGEQDKKIEFSQKLSNEDKQDLPKQTPSSSGGFNLLKNEKQSLGVNSDGLKSGSSSISKKNGENKSSEKKSGFFGLFKKKNSIKTGMKGSILDVNLVRGEIVKYFDWQKGVLVLLISISSSLAIISFVYWGISWWGSKIEYVRDPFLIQTYSKLDKEIRSLDNNVKEVSVFKERIQLVDDLLNSHVYWTNYFTLLEKATLSNVSFSNFTGDISGPYSLSATTNDFDAIDAQIKNFIANKYIKQAQVDSGTISGAGEDGALASFSLNFSIDQKLFIE